MSLSAEQDRKMILDYKWKKIPESFIVRIQNSITLNIVKYQ